MTGLYTRDLRIGTGNAGKPVSLKPFEHWNILTPMFMYRLRKRVKVVLWIVVFGFIAWIFFELGADIVGRRFAKPWERGIIAEIDGHAITFQTYNAVFNQMYQDSVKKKGGRDLTDQEEAALERAAWEKVIEDARWAEIIQKRNLNLSDAAVVQIIENSPPRDLLNREELKDSAGNFDIRKYRQLLRDPRNLPYFVNYERQLREEIPKEIARADILLGPSASLREAWERYRFQNTRVKGLYMKVAIPLIPDSLIQYTEEDLQRYYQTHKQDYTQKERVNLAFVIFRKVPSSEDTMTALDRIKSALEELKAGTSFEEVAKYYTDDDQTRDQGGFIGTIARDRVPPQVKAVLDTLPLQKVSDPFLSPYGWEVVKVDRRTPDSVTVWHILVTIRTSSDTRDRIRQEAEEFYAQAQEVGFEEAAKAMGLEVRETDFFPRDLPFIPTLGRVESLLEFVKTAKKGELSPLIRRPQDYIVAYVKDVDPEHVIPFKDAKESVEMDYKRSRKEAIADSIAQEIYQRWLQGEDPRSIQKSYGSFVSLSDTFDVKLSQVIPGVPMRTPAYGALAAASPGTLLPPMKISRNYFIFQVLDKEEPSPEAFAQQQATILNNLKFRYVNALWQDWNNEMKKEQGIKDYRRYLLY